MACSRVNFMLCLSFNSSHLLLFFQNNDLLIIYVYRGPNVCYRHVQKVMEPEEYALYAYT